MSEINKPVFTKRIFWDVNFDDLDYTGKTSFITGRVFERDDVEDIRRCRRYYGDEKVKGVLLNAKALSEHRLYLASAVVGEPLNAFRCCTLRQLHPERFPY